LPFAQRHGSRMMDVILAPPGETATSFELFLGCDRPQPALAGQGVTSPVAVVPLDRGPPSVGQQGWLAHLDTANVLLTLTPSGCVAAITDIGLAMNINQRSNVIVGTPLYSSEFKNRSFVEATSHRFGF
jgi:hypothetical protein